MNMHQQRAVELTAAKSILQSAQAEARGLTTNEKSRANAHLKAVEDLDIDIKAANESHARLQRVANLGFEDGAATGSPGYFGAKSRVAGSIATAMADRGAGAYGQKALLVAGDIFADVPMLSTDPLSLPRPPVSILDALPVNVITTPTYNYLRQTTRTNLAAPVALGGTKPTSLYGLTPVPGTLNVLAHISEPFDEYWVSDSASLLRFLEAEMVAGLYSAAEAQILTGNGTAPNLRGLASTSGIQTQAFVTDMILTARKAITKVEVLGYESRMFVLNPTDWETIETSTLSAGTHVLNAEGQGNLPVDRAARKLWGVPVVLSISQAAGAAWLISTGSVEVVTDGVVKVKVTDAVDDDFSKNHLRMRTESRFDLAVPAPLGVVSIDLTV